MRKPKANSTPSPFKGKYKQKKALGQVFLVNDQPAQQTIACLKENDCRHVLEIGPGEGALTRELIKSGISVTAVEVDVRFCEKLSFAFEVYRDQNPDSIADLNIVEADILEKSMDEWIEVLGPFDAIVGNIPYQISSKILLHIAAASSQIPLVILLTQKEFAQRLFAMPRTKSYGSFSVLLQLSFKIESLLDVPRTWFKPVPKVDSLLFKMTPNKYSFSSQQKKIIEKTARIAFANRRKKLVNALKPFIDENKRAEIEAKNFDLNRRAEELALDEFYELGHLLFE